MLIKESYIKEKKEQARLHLLIKLEEMCDYNCCETNMNIRDELMKVVGGIIEEISEEREELKEALRFTHNKLYTLYHTKDSIARRDIEIDMIKAYFKSGDTLFLDGKYMLNKDWPNQRSIKD